MSNGYMIVNTPIAVDYWHVARQPHIRFFFLTHCHADHAQGLSKTWHRRIYCSPVTAKLASHLFGVRPDLLEPLEVDETLTIDDDDGQEPEKRTFHVTALEADHCPGAVMFLFDGWFGRILCTGDFRYEILKGVIDIDRLKFRRIDRLYLDGTNWRNETRLPTREEATKRALDMISKRPDDETILLSMPQAKLGKEKLLVAISQRFEQRIFVDKIRLGTLRVLQLEKYFTDDATETRFHLLSGTPWRLSRVVDSYEAMGQRIFFLVLTSLRDWKSALESREMNPRYSFDSSNSAVIPYSDHSSREELEAFLDCLRISQITLTGCKEAKVLSPDERACFEEVNEPSPTFRAIGARETRQDNVQMALDFAGTSAAETDCEMAVCGGNRIELVATERHEEEVVVMNAHRVEDEPLAEEGRVESELPSENPEEADKAVVGGREIIVASKNPDQAAEAAMNAEGPSGKSSPSFLMTYEDNMVFTDKEIDAILAMDISIFQGVKRQGKGACL